MEGLWDLTTEGMGKAKGDAGPKGDKGDKGDRGDRGDPSPSVPAGQEAQGIGKSTNLHI